MVYAGQEIFACFSYSWTGWVLEQVAILLLGSTDDACSSESSAWTSSTVEGQIGVMGTILMDRKKTISRTGIGWNINKLIFAVKK